MAEPMVGEIRILAGKETPPGWACCDGQLLSINDYKALFSVLGTMYGGDGRTTFALPDMRGRTPIHPDKDAYRLGKTGGEAKHALTVNELPGHAHDSLALIGVAATQSGPQTIASSAPVATLAAQERHGLFGIGTPAEDTAAEGHDNLQPYSVVTYVIALHGATPSRK